jgi:predicted ArsR family transcriptional regulator
MKIIKRKASEILVMIDQLIVGLLEFAEEFTPSRITVDMLQDVRARLADNLQKQVKAQGEAEKATQNLENTRDEAVYMVRQTRDAVYAHFSKYDARIVKFGLDTLAKKRKKSNGDENGAA